MRQSAILAIDEGTTNAKAVLVSENGHLLVSGSCAVATAYPQTGWVQQDAETIWQATLSAIEACLKQAPDVQVCALGITNQRESVLIWDRKTGEALGPVVTWQCRRTVEICTDLVKAGHEADVLARTGLPIDPMFPGPKIQWLLDRQGKAGADICIGTVDSWLIWKLSGGKTHATDRSNAARSQLFNLHQNEWDSSLCALFGVQRDMLPEVCDSSHIFSTTQDVGLVPDGIPIASAIGDSHAALFGHGAFSPGDGKVTFGTGSSVMTTIPCHIPPPQGLTTTIAWSIGGNSTYALEGNILVSASILPWTADLLGLNGDINALLDLAQTVETSSSVSLVPAHVGLGAPHWHATARGLICGLSFNSGRAHVARAAAESVALQVRDIHAIMQLSADAVGMLYVDGGPSQNQFLMQLVADCLSHPIHQAENSEASAIGAAYLAGLSCGVWASVDDIFHLERRSREIKPRIDPHSYKELTHNWAKAVARTVHTV